MASLPRPASRPQKRSDFQTSAPRSRNASGSRSMPGRRSPGSRPKRRSRTVRRDLARTAVAMRSRRVSRMRRCRSRSQTGWPIARLPGCTPQPSLPSGGTSVRRSTSGSARAAGSGATCAEISPKDRRTSRWPVHAHRAAHARRRIEQERAERAVLERTAHHHAVPRRREPRHLDLDVVLVGPEPVRVGEDLAARPACSCAAASPIFIALSKCSTRIASRTPDARGSRRRPPRTPRGSRVSRAGPTGMPPP